MRNQPVPVVSEADVERIVRRDFPSEQFSTVMNVLNEYGIEQWERERPRIQLAALKLASGDVHKLRFVINEAKRDYRDVLAGAEYPGYAKKFSSKCTPSSHQEAQVIESDWKQYDIWLRRET